MACNPTEELRSSNIDYFKKFSHSQHMKIQNYITIYPLYHCNIKLQYMRQQILLSQKLNYKLPKVKQNMKILIRALQTIFPDLI